METAKTNGKAKNKAKEATGSIDAKLAKKVRKEVGDEAIVDWYKQMMVLRRFEEVAGRQYQMGKIKGFCHLYIGQEAVAIGAIGTLTPDDYVIAAYREHGHAIAKGIEPNAVMAELFGKADGCSGGVGGSMHLFDVSKKFYGGWGIVGGHIPTAAGMAFAAKYKDEGAVVLCFFGEGSIHQGVVHETFNMASKWDLPCVFITENNKYAMGTSIERISAVIDIEKKGDAYAMDNAQIDGRDIFAVYDGVKQAVDRARKNNRPTFLNILTYRYRGHSMSDPAKYRTKEEVEKEQSIGPIVRLQNWLVSEKLLDEAALDEIDANAKQIAKDAVAFADASPQPDPSVLTNNVYVDWPWAID